MKKVLIAAALLLALLLFVFQRTSPPTVQHEVRKLNPSKQVSAQLAQVKRDGVAAEANAKSVMTPAQPQATAVEPGAASKPALHYKLQNGMFVVQGDVVVGVPTREGVEDTGLVEFVPGGQWTGGVIPYHIQPDVPNPSRVMQALAMFDGTAIRFVPQQGEEDVLVFENGEKDCLSYVGKIGGKQPVYLSLNCAPADIAHEILHALGFVHEQNRADRDQFIRVNFENIDESNKYNFEKLSSEFMKVSGLSPFDFESLMIYPVWMFAKGGQSTMESLIPDKQIRPSSGLSALDVARLNRAYR